VLNAGATYTTFEQAYALSLYLMTQKYKDADILCLGMEDNSHSNFTFTKQEQYDLVISALAQYFGCTFVDQTGDYSEINTENMHHYTMDTSCLHPNSMGHAAMTRMIMRALADVCEKNG
jgi:hypothetical protein